MQAGDRKGAYTVESLRGAGRGGARAGGAAVRALQRRADAGLRQRRASQIVSHGERNAAQRSWVHDYFEREVRPLLIPVGLDPAHPFPQVANKSLNFIVRLGGQGRLRPRERDRHRQGAARAAAADPHAGQGVGQQDAVRLAVQRDPGAPGRAVPGPRGRRSSRSSASPATPTWRWTRTTCATCAPRCAWGCSTGTTGRRCGWRCRRAAPTSCPSFLLQQFNLPPQRAVPRAWPGEPGAAAAADRPGRRAAAAVPAVQAVLSRRSWCPASRSSSSCSSGDVLIHQPFESFDGVLAFLREAVQRPAGAGHQADHLPHRRRFRH